MLLNEAVKYVHFEVRESQNKNLPATSNEAMENKNFVLQTKEASALHQDKVGNMEQKFVTMGGQEAVYDGNNGTLVTDPQIKGSYNFVPYSDPEQGGNKSGVLDAIGHAAADVAPWVLYGNDRNDTSGIIDRASELFNADSTEEIN